MVCSGNRTYNLSQCWHKIAIVEHMSDSIKKNMTSNCHQFSVRHVPKKYLEYQCTVFVTHFMHCWFSKATDRRDLSVSGISRIIYRSACSVQYGLPTLKMRSLGLLDEIFSKKIKQDLLSPRSRLQILYLL